MNNIIDNQKPKQSSIKIGVVIPTRGDRPEFFENCMRMLENQTVHVEWIQIMSYKPESDQKDITQRYRRGYEYFPDDCNVDVIAFIEDDDYYAPDYLETMVREWDAYGRPDIFGTNYTIYYHLKLKKYFTMNHPDRASAMNTLIKPGLKIKWPADSEPYTDMALWSQIKGQTFKPSKIISMGMKHGVGLCGGANHNDRLHRYKTDDNGFLKAHLDEKSFEFYSNVNL